MIVVNAHRVNRGEMPLLGARAVPDRSDASSDGAEPDFFLVERKEPEDVLTIVKKLVAERIPARFGFDPKSAIQVLTPMHRGLLGAANLNAELQALLNPRGTAITRGRRPPDDRSRRSTSGVSAYARTPPMTKGVSTGPSARSTRNASNAMPSQAAARFCVGVNCIGWGRRGGEPREGCRRKIPQILSGALLWAVLLP